MDQSQAPKSKGPRQASKHFPVGTVMPGDDGKDWYVHQMPNGSTRWQKCKAPAAPRQYQQPQQPPQNYQQQQPSQQPPANYQQPPRQYQQQQPAAPRLMPVPIPPPSSSFTFRSQQTQPTFTTPSGFQFQANPFFHQQQPPSQPNPFQTSSSAVVQPASSFSAGPTYYSELLATPAAVPIIGPSTTPGIVLQPSAFNESMLMQLER